MPKMLRRTLVYAIAAVCSRTAFGAPSQRLTLLQVYNRAHENYIALNKARTVAMPQHFAAPMAKIFGLLFARAGVPLVPYEIRVVQDSSLNASTLIGPYFTISTGMLAAIDARAVTANEIPVPKGINNAVDYRREVLLAGVISHEIGHFLAGHGLRSLIEDASLNAASPAEIAKSVMRSQEDEFDADKIGYQLMESAGYMGANLYHTLRILHDAMQKKCQSPTIEIAKQCHSYSYADSHPALHARLASFQNKHKKFHEEMLRLEMAVAWVNQGQNLREALQIIEAELKAVPNNSYFLKIKALAKHKRWLETVSLAEQQLRIILSVPAFHDQLASGSRKSRSATEIPGNKYLFYAAKKAYEQANLSAPPPAYFLSAQLGLLAYDPDEREEATRKSRALVLAQPDLTVVNNHALILYLSGRTAEALNILAAIAQSVDRAYMGLANASTSNTDAALQKASLDSFTRNMRVYDSAFVHTEFTPLLNVAVMLAIERKSKKSKEIASHYLKNYDSDSAWARRLASLTGQSVPLRRNLEEVVLKRLNIASQSLKPIGKRARLAKNTSLPAEGNVIYLDDQRARVVTTALGVRGITVYAGSPLKIDNQIGIGSTRGEVEKLWGKSARIVQGYTVYGSSVMIGIRYDDDRVAEFTLQ
jgi:hypothetical protein